MFKRVYATRWWRIKDIACNVSYINFIPDKANYEYFEDSLLDFIDYACASCDCTRCPMFKNKFCRRLD